QLLDGAADRRERLVGRLDEQQPLLGLLGLALPGVDRGDRADPLHARRLTARDQLPGDPQRGLRVGRGDVDLHQAVPAGPRCGHPTSLSAAARAATPSRASSSVMAHGGTMWMRLATVSGHIPRSRQAFAIAATLAAAGGSRLSLSSTSSTAQ